MHRIIREIKKRLLYRLWFWIIWITIGIIIDEYIKEGYLFRVEDIYNPNFTHEKIIIILLIILCYSIIIKYKARTIDRKM